MHLLKKRKVPTYQILEKMIEQESRDQRVERFHYWAEIWPTSLFYLWPSMPPLLLAKSAFFAVEPLQLVYAFVYGPLVVGAALFWASRSIDRFVVRGEFTS